MTKDEALKLALEALENAEYGDYDKKELNKAITAIREALAQPEQEPVAYTTGHCENHKQKGGRQLHNLQCGWPDCDRKPITTPPHRKPLSDVEIWNTYKNLWMFHPAEEPRLAGDVLKFARAIEQAHGIKE